MSWLRMQMVVLDGAGAVVSFAANWFLQSTLLIAVGLTIAWLLRRRGSALQSAIYRTTLATAIVCPLASGVLASAGVSGWSLRMPAAWTYEELSTPVLAGAEPAGSTFVVPPRMAEPPAGESTPWPSRTLEGDSLQTEIGLLPATPQPSLPYGRTESPAADGVGPTRMPQEPSTESAVGGATRTGANSSELFHVRPFGVAALGIALVWLSASAWLLMRLTNAWRQLKRLCQQAVSAEPAIQDICRELAASLDVTAPRVLRTPYLSSPCLAGWRRPKVLLPEADFSLPAHDVLIHELAHLCRGDAGWNLMGRLAEATFFYQPLVWLLTRRLEAAAEEVCDDYVVQFGGDRSRYARGLLEIAELSAAPVGATAVAIVSLRSILAKRVTRIMDSSRSLSTRAGNLLLAVVIAGGLVGTLAAGFVGLGSRSADAQTGPESAAKAAEQQTKEEPAGESETPPDQAVRTEEKRKDADAADESNRHGDNGQPASDNQFQGIVRGADGKPVPGAKFYWIRSRVHDVQPQPPQLLATTGEDGRYRFAEPPAIAEDVPATWSYNDRIVVRAPGHGFVFTSPGEIRPNMQPPEGIVAALASALAAGRVGAINLPAAGDPIRGRLVDIDGRPVAGATVRIRWFNDESDRGSWSVQEAEARGAKNAVLSARVTFLMAVIEPVQLREVLPTATSDAEGWFELRDIGPKRFVQLLVQGDGIEATEIIARNEPGEKIVIEEDRHTQGGSLTLYPNEFVHAVGPSKAVKGRVLDLDTGEPIAGAIVRAFQVHGQRVSTSREREHFAATTDEGGRYLIKGLPIGSENALVAFATGDVPYVPVARSADTTGSENLIQQDFRLKRGLWAEGRVFDAETDRPFTGEMSCYLFRNRELEEAIPGLRQAYVDGLYWTNAKGEFRVPVLPSRGVLAFRYDGRAMDRDGIDRFPRGLGADDISGSEDLGGTKVFPTIPFYLMPTNYERLAEVPATSGKGSIRVDMPLFASRPVKVQVVDAAGEPVSKFQVYGANERFGWQGLDGPEFEIQDLRPGERRKVFVFHRDRNLAGGRFIESGSEQAVRLVLEEAGSVQGRLVDADGEPINDATLTVNFENLRSGDDSAIWAPHPSLQANPTHIPVDKDGRFRLDGLVPGWRYHAYATAPRPYQGQTLEMVIGTALKGVEAKAGEDKDLGDIVVEGRP